MSIYNMEWKKVQKFHTFYGEKMEIPEFTTKLESLLRRLDHQQSTTFDNLLPY